MHFNLRLNQRRRMRSMLRVHGKYCHYCGCGLAKRGPSRKRASRDHVVPKARWNEPWRKLGYWQFNVDHPDNIVLACVDCNEDKGMLDGEEYRAVREGRASRLDHRKHARAGYVGGYRHVAACLEDDE